MRKRSPQTADLSHQVSKVSSAQDKLPRIEAARGKEVTGKSVSVLYKYRDVCACIYLQHLVEYFFFFYYYLLLFSSEGQF